MNRPREAASTGKSRPLNGETINRRRRTRLRATTGAAVTTATAFTRATRAPTPSIRHSGRIIRPTAGTSANSATIAGSASKASNWLPYPAASHPKARTSQARRAGNRTRTRAVPLAPAIRAAPTSGTASARTTTGRATARSNRRADRRNHPNSGKINAKNRGSFKNRRATTAPNPATIHPNRRTNSGTSAGEFGKEGNDGMLIILIKFICRFKPNLHTC